MSKSGALVGMDRRTGAPISGIVHLKQSLGDILGTRKGSRRERPDYGSDIPLMVDLPITRGWVSAAQAEAARAIGRWEPRIKLAQVKVLSVVEGKVTFAIRGEYDGAAVEIEVPT
ncbi:GPW/gp25 family protein [Burkholderia stagnalis]|uniref:GPW/gp25 family protein n=1 Tax=Burkholderia stagnalis TaxID=1503054 RepID=UPI000755213A|nr:GPW/gp25 family protein [Burkholderia stagnalis]KVL94313.1 phage baseplate protein [Burkholderia stagnalis]KVL98846.1 phage baseplate protein [Burkholderia stagnalis]KVM07898.1 phage baseplate protein [Burkholderia stagnalis]KWK15285.1 phage baseplate protein [Burkholderia stagnalis]KWO21522.1 phage baseplate protein [Burkholderia stagnalis]